MSNRRVDEIKKSLDSDVYKKIDSLERLKDDTLTSTEKLVDILDGYMTKLDDFEVDEDITTMEVVSENEVNIEVDDRDMLREYNEKIHDFSLETLTELLSDSDVKQIHAAEKVEFENKDIDKIIDEMDNYKLEELEQLESLVDNNKSKEELTQSLSTPAAEQISNFELEEDSSKNQEIVNKKITPSQEEEDAKKPKKRVQPQKNKKNKLKKLKQIEQIKQKDKNKVDLILLIILVAVILFLLVNVFSIL